MSSPETPEARYGEIVRELRAGRAAAPAELRLRVRRIATAEAPPARPSRRRRWEPRRIWLGAGGLAAAAAAAAVAVAVIGGGESGRVATSEPPSTATTGDVFAAEAPAAREKAPPAAPDATPPTVKAGAGAAASTVAPNPGRATLYSADIVVTVQNLSRSTKRALAITRSLGGFVRSADYGTGGSSGGAQLAVRVPIGRVQEAIVRFTSLGTIVTQDVRIQDAQPGIDRRFRRLQAVRAQITALRRQLAATSLTEEQTRDLGARLAARQRLLRALQADQAKALRRVSFATVQLGLRKAKPKVVVPAVPSRIDRALDRTGHLLLRELEILLYVSVVAVPLAVLAALLLAGSRTRRRRLDERLLAR